MNSSHYCKSFYMLIVLLPLFHVRPTLAQSLTVEGIVIDSKTEQVVPYASIGIVDFNIGTIANVDGMFSLKVPLSIAGKFRLKVSCIGYESEFFDRPRGYLKVMMKESATLLKGVVVMSQDVSPQRIVRNFFRNIKKNYYTKPFQYKMFYRHYCKDDSTYGRLIEAAVDFYKRKGHKTSQPTPGTKEEIRVTQLRRSFDNTKLASGHVPFAFYLVAGSDPASYQTRSPYDIAHMFDRFNTSHLKKDLKRFTFELEGITEFDHEKVYVIRYKYGKDSVHSVSGIPLVINETGKLYITSKDFALVKALSTKKRRFDTVTFLTSYKKLNGKYFLSHAVEEGHTFYMKEKFKHQYHLELTTTDIQLKNFEDFRGKEPVKEELLAINYDSSFWNDYNILKATPLEENIVRDLQKNQSLKTQYGDFVEQERERVLGGKEEEEKFNKALKGFAGSGRPILLDFWATWCGPCIAQMRHSKELFEKYKHKVHFVYLSLDSDWKKWQDMVKKYELKGMHFRIGPTSDAAILFNVESIPRFVLLDQNGSVVSFNAKRPGDPELAKEIDKLIGSTQE